MGLSEMETKLCSGRPIILLLFKFRVFLHILHLMRCERLVYRPLTLVKLALHELEEAIFSTYDVSLA